MPDGSPFSKIGRMRWIRKRVGWISGAAIAGFLLWLTAEAVSLRAAPKDAAGLLFGRKVSLTDYRKALEAAQHEAILQHGDKASQQVPPEELAHQAWERLTLLAEARRLRIRVTDQEVVQEIGRWPLFQGKGAFDRSGYETLIRYSLGTVPRVFEEEIREGLAIRKLFEQAVAPAPAQESQVKELFLKKETSIRVSLLSLLEEKLAQEVADAARQNPDQLAQAAKQLKRKLIPIDFFKGETDLPDWGRAQITFGPAFSLEPGQVTGPLPSRRGWLVVKLEAKQPPDERLFPELKESLQKELEARQRLERYIAWYQDLKKRANLKKK